MEESQAEELVKEYLLSEECPKIFQKEIEREAKMLSGEKPTYRFISIALPILTGFLLSVATKILTDIFAEKTAKLTQDNAEKIAAILRKRFIGERARTEEDRTILERRLPSEEETKRYGAFVYYTLTRAPMVSYSQVLEGADMEVHEYLKAELGLDVSNVQITVCDLKNFIDQVYEGRTVDFEKTEIYRMLEEGDIRVENFLSAFTDPNKGVAILIDPEKARQYPELSDFFSVNYARLANVLTHEKYGHGFFFNQTELGRILASYGFFKRDLVSELPEEDVGRRILARKLEPLYYSSLIPSEGFAVWLQKKVLGELSTKHPEQAQALSKERTEMFQLIGQRVDPFSRDRNDYFEEFFTGSVNPYSLGFSLCEMVETNFGPACVPRLLEIAANIKFTLDFKYTSREEIIHALKDSRLRCDKRFENIAHLKPTSDFVHNSILMFEKLVRKEFGYSMPKRTVTIAR